MGKDILQPTLFRAYCELSVIIVTEECDIEDEDTKSVPDEEEDDTLESKRKKVPNKIQIKKIKHVVKSNTYLYFREACYEIYGCITWSASCSLSFQESQRNDIQFREERKTWRLLRYKFLSYCCC